MYRLTVNNKPYGQLYFTEEKAIAAHKLMSAIVNGLGWTKA